MNHVTTVVLNVRLLFTACTVQIAILEMIISNVSKSTLPTHRTGTAKVNVIL